MSREQEKNADTKKIKEDDSMGIVVTERDSYKRLDFGMLNFADENEIDEDSMENITPIHWTKKILSGEKEVIIKKR